MTSTLPTMEVKECYSVRTTNIQGLVKLCQEVGFVDTSLLSFHVNTSQGCHVRATTEICEGNKLLELPMKLLITAEQVKESEFGIWLMASIPELQSDPDDDIYLLASYLLSIHKLNEADLLTGSSSDFLRAYLSSLPPFDDRVKTPLGFTKAQWARFWPTNYADDVLNRLEAWRSMYLKVVELDSSSSDFLRFFPLHPSENLAASFTWDEFLWAMTMVQTRVFMLPPMSDTKDSRETASLIPLVDLFNHASYTKSPFRVERFRADSTDNRTDDSREQQRSSTLVTIYSSRTLVKGEEIYNTYDVRDASFFLSFYGFVPQEQAPILEHYRLRLDRILCPPDAELRELEIDSFAIAQLVMQTRTVNTNPVLQRGMSIKEKLTCFPLCLKDQVVSEAILGVVRILTKEEDHSKILSTLKDSIKRQIDKFDSWQLQFGDLSLEEKKEPTGLAAQLNSFLDRVESLKLPQYLEAEENQLRQSLVDSNIDRIRHFEYKILSHFYSLLTTKVPEQRQDQL